MKLTDIFIKRPVLAICVNLIILVAGFQAVMNITTRQYPRSDLAVITVRTAYIGAGADLVRGYVTTPLERIIASADGIDYLESSSVQGMSTISAHLRLNYDLNAALTQIQSKVAQVRNELPPEAESPIINLETSDNRFASMYISFYSDELEANQITDYLVRVVQPRLSAIAGVQKAEILGARTFAMRIWMHPEKMAAYGVSPGDIEQALRANNALSAVGVTKGSLVSVNLAANTDLKTKEEFQQLVVRSQGDTLVRLQDVADVVLGAENYDEDVRFSGQMATFMGIWALPNANSLDVIALVREAFPEIEKNLPRGLHIGVPYDSTEYIRDALHEVFSTLAETILIVVIVIYLFIGSMRSVIVPVVAIPLSLLGAAALMFVMGFTLNLLTLLAIVLAVGLVVDDAIVMLENVERHVAEGKKPFQAAIVAARELVGPTIAMTITLAAVYAPIGIQGGLTGALFKEFAFTLAGAVVISGFVALTLSPMMSSRLVKQGHGGGFQASVERFFFGLQERYERMLSTSLQLRPAILSFALVFMLLLPALYLFSMKELAPREDQGVVFGILQSAPNATLDQTTKYSALLQEVYKSFPEYKASFQLTSAAGGFSGFVTKPWSERARTTQEMEGEAWGKTSRIPGVRLIITTPPPLPGGSDFPIELVLSSTAEPRELLEYAQKLVGAAFASEKFMFADADLKYDLPQSEIVIDRDKVAAMGLKLDDIARNLGTYTGGDYVNRFSVQGRSYKVIPQAIRSERLTPEQLLDLRVPTPSGELVSVSTFAKLKETVEPRALNRFQQLNSVKIQGAVIPGNSINDGLRVLEEEAAKILPPGFSIDYAGESRQLRKEGNALMTTLFFALLIIYLVLAAQFESFRDPFIILAGSVPLALTGAMLLVFLGFTSLNIYSQVGLVTLVGLIAKNGILIVEFANKLQDQGVDRFEAIIKGASTRLRPVLMTSVATVFGHFPLVLASGAGAAARNSIGIVLVSGMILGTILTLFVLPAIYSVVSKRSRHDESDVEVVNSSTTGRGEGAGNGTRPSYVVPGEALKRNIGPLLWLVFLPVVNGCSVGPDYQPPEITLPQTFTESESVEKPAVTRGDATQSTSTPSTESTENWWTRYNDARLDELVNRAIANNREIDLAIERVKESRAMARSAFSELLPGTAVRGGYETGRTTGSRFAGADNQGLTYDIWSAAADFLWEVDLFGRLRRGVESSDAQLEASAANVDNVGRMVISEVVSTYLQLRGAESQITVVEENIRVQAETLKMISTRSEAGTGTELDVALASAQLGQVRSQLPPLEKMRKLATYRLGVLVGALPETLAAEFKERAAMPIFSGNIPISSPVSLLHRRPDLYIAERQLAAYTAEIGIAEGELYPKVTFEGNLAVEASRPEDWFRGGASAYTFLLPKISWKPFDNGKLRQQILAASARAEQALKQYEQAIFLALEEAEGALATFGAAKKTGAELLLASRHSAKALELARVEYEVGSKDYLTVLEAQKAHLAIELGRVQSTTATELALVDVLRAFGGGWSLPLKSEIKQTLLATN